MSRGRKEGTIVRWSKWADAQIWAHVAFIKWRDGITVRESADRLAKDGYWHSRAGKAWLTRPATADDGEAAVLIQALIEAGKIVPGDTRNDFPGKTFRQRYYAAIRRARTDAEFKADCAFWLRFLKKNHGSDDEIEAFFAATEKPGKQLT